MAGCSLYSSSRLENRIQSIYLPDLYYRYRVRSIYSRIYTQYKMDLSSLEGPPISDGKFTPQVRYHQPDTYIPSIRVDYADHDTSLRRYKRTDDHHTPRHGSGHYYRNTDYRDVSSSTGPRLSPGDNSTTNSMSTVHAQRPRARSNPPPQQRQPGTASDGRPSTPNRLVWIDSQQTWLLIGSRVDMGQPQLQPQPQPRQQQHHHHQVLDADRPPSYGNHQRDRILAMQPMGRRSRDEDEEEYECEERGAGLSRSKWGAVARRVNRMA